MRPPFPLHRLLSVAVLSLLLSGCSATGTLNTLTPSAHQQHIEVAYGSQPRQTADIYLPTLQTGATPPVVVFVYGGAWEQGSKDDFAFVAHALTRLGYIAVVPDYRIYPEVEFPYFVTDVADAIAALPSVFAEQVPSLACGDRLNIVLAGHSAGAHTAALLATDPSYFKQAGFNGHIEALVLMSGPYDLPLEHPRVAEKFSQVQGNEANPLALANRSLPPTLLLHGAGDSVAAPQHAERFYERLVELGTDVELTLYPRTQHIDVIASFSWPLRFLTPAYRDTENWLDGLQLPPACSPN